eukprot:2121243-Amphidinium_carterae.1
MGILARVCRLVCGVPPDAPPPEPVIPPIHVAPAPAPISTIPRVKISAVADPLNEAEVDVLQPAAIQACYEVFRSKLGDFPRPEEECTAAQITALDRIFRSGGS